MHAQHSDDDDDLLLIKKNMPSEQSCSLIEYLHGEC